MEAKIHLIAFSSFHQEALSFNLSLLGLQIARKCFTVKRYMLQENLLETFHQTFLNVLLVPQNQIIFGENMFSKNVSA